MKENKPSVAIVSGSFDPITLGHLDIVKRTASIFDRVYVAALINPEKEYMLDRETCKMTLAKACEDITNVSTLTYDGYLVELARELDCNVVVRGIRDANDLKYETDMAEWNKNASGSVETLFMPCDKRLCDISSSRVRKLISDKRYDDAEALLPTGVMKIIKDYLCEEK